MNRAGLPSKEELISDDPVIAEAAWAKAYPVLWAKGMVIVVHKMRAANQQDRENVVAEAIQQFQKYLFEEAKRGRRTS